MKELTIIIVTYNSKEAIDKCLNGIVSENFDILIVDNASSDGGLEFLQQKYNDVRVINSGKNLGYGRAANIGFKAATTEYALLMNPDVTTSKEAILELLKTAKENKNSAICAPRTYKDRISKIENVDWVSGAVMLFDMKKLKDIGLFDENIFLFYEETDICKRTKNLGYDIMLFNDIYFDHMVGKSSGFSEKISYLKYWHGAWSRFYFNKKHLSQANFFKKSLSYILKFILKYFMYMFLNNKEKKVKYKASINGAMAFLTGEKAFDTNGNPKGIK